MRETSELIQKNMDQVLGLKESFKEVKDCTEQTRTVNDSITSAIQIASDKMDQTADGVQQIRNAVEGIDHSVEELNDKSSRKNITLSEMTDMLQQFHNMS